MTYLHIYRNEYIRTDSSRVSFYSSINITENEKRKKHISLLVPYASAV